MCIDPSTSSRTFAILPPFTSAFRERTVSACLVTASCATWIASTNCSVIETRFTELEL